jgi:hypothetical protein
MLCYTILTFRCPSPHCAWSSFSALAVTPEGQHPRRAPVPPRCIGCMQPLELVSTVYDVLRVVEALAQRSGERLHVSG